MKLRLPHDSASRLVRALAHAGHREIGGQLFGEQLAPSDFRVSRLVVQERAGSFARFVVDVAEAARQALSFFRHTGNDFRRHNYIGEWHSHPSFAVAPSGTDVDTMRALVRAPDFGGTFAVLMIVRFDQPELKAGAWVFDPQGREGPVELEFEP